MYVYAHALRETAKHIKLGFLRQLYRKWKLFTNSWLPTQNNILDDLKIDYFAPYNQDVNEFGTVNMHKAKNQPLMWKC